MQSSTKLRRNPVIEGDPLSASLECFGLFDQLFTTTIQSRTWATNYLATMRVRPNTIHHCFIFSVWWLSCFFFFEGWCFLDIAFASGLHRALAKFESIWSGQFFGRNLLRQVKQWWA